MRPPIALTLGRREGKGASVNAYARSLRGPERAARRLQPRPRYQEDLARLEERLDELDALVDELAHVAKLRASRRRPTPDSQS